MSHLTEEAIRAEFIRLLNDRPLDKITVREIADACGINRNTFYYHFSDIPTLVEELVKDEFDRIMQTSHGIQSLEECVEAAVRLTLEHRQAVWHIYNSANRDIYVRYLMDICNHVVSVFVDKAIAGRPVSEADREIIIQGYSCECFGFITDWLSRGMCFDLKARLLRLCALRRGMTEEMLHRSLGGEV